MAVSDPTEQLKVIDYQGLVNGTPKLIEDNIINIILEH
jgi:hypothetical protein